jgi:ribosomal protein L37AE/L43A
VKASARRAWQRDLRHRQCPECRNRDLTPLSPDVVWCENCGKTGLAVAFPYQQYWSDHLQWKAERDAVRAEKEAQ